MEAGGQWVEYDDAERRLVSAVTVEPCFLNYIMRHADVAAGLLLAVHCMLHVV